MKVGTPVPQPHYVVYNPSGEDVLLCGGSKQCSVVISDGFGSEDSDTRSEIYVRSGDWEAPRISSLLVSHMGWNNTNPRAPLSYIEKYQRVTLTRDFFSKKLTSTNPIGSLISGIRSSLTLSEIAFSVGISPA